MRKFHGAVLAGLMLVLGATGGAVAGMPYPQKIKCAVGGKPFTYTSTASLSTWGSRPDGKPYGSWIFPMPLPECPNNGLIMYRDFTKDEVSALAGLIATPEYRAMVATERPYYRAAWLERALKPGSDSIPWMLLSASWQADESPDQKARYQREFIAAAAAAPAPVGDDLSWRALQARVANAHRELGDFEAAAARLAGIRADDLDVAIPKLTNDNFEAYDAAQSRQGLRGYLADLAVVVARRDSASEPLDMLPLRMAADACLEAKERAVELRPDGICARPDIAKEMEDIRQYDSEPAGGDEALADRPAR